MAVVDVAFAGGDNFEKSTVPFLQALGDRLAIWIDHHEHPVGWARYRDDPRFLLVPNQQAHACPELVTPEVVARAGAVDVVVAHADLDGLLSAVKFLRGGVPPWPEADEDARAADSPGRGHAFSARARLLSDALDHAAAELRSAAARSVPAADRAGAGEGQRCRPRSSSASRSWPARKRRPWLRWPLSPSRRRKRRKACWWRAFPRRWRGRSRRRCSPGSRSVRRWAWWWRGAPSPWRPFATLDLAQVDELGAGRSDYRFGQAEDGGRRIVARLGELVRAELE